MSNLQHFQYIAHSLNLCLQDAGRKLVCLRDALEICRGMVDLTHLSLKTLHLFSSNLEVSSGGVTLKPLCPTRWTAWTAAINAILKDYPVMMDTLEEIQITTHNECGLKASGFLHSLKKFNTLFGHRLPTLFLVQRNKCPWPSRKEIYPYRMDCLQLMQVRHITVDCGRRRNLTASMM